MYFDINLNRKETWCKANEYRIALMYGYVCNANFKRAYHQACDLARCAQISYLLQPVIQLFFANWTPKLKKNEHIIKQGTIYPSR